MTDNEIIKALKRIAQYSGFTDDVSNTLLSALDLINRQKAEIERLNIELQSMRSAANSYKMHYETAKSEAIKEVAKRLKDNYCFTDRWGKIIPISTVDNLVKEMTEVETNQRKEDENEQRRF